MADSGGQYARLGAGAYKPMVMVSNELEKHRSSSFSSGEQSSESECLSDETDADEAPHQGFLFHLLDERSDSMMGKVFSSAVTGIILLNTLVMSMEADMPDLVDLWAVVDNIFLGFFVCELSSRLIYFRFRFFTDPLDRGWNIFDFSIVMMGVLDQWVKPLVIDESEGGSAGGGAAKMILILRTLRILRVLRAIRLFKNLKALYLMMQGLIASLQSVMWVGVLFLLLMLVSSIFLTNIVGKQSAEFEDPAAIEGWFGTIASTMDTLFVYLTCDDWSTSARMVNDSMPLMEIFWVFYMFLGTFTLLSLLTGLMADKMNEVREESEDRADMAAEAQMEQKLVRVEKLFQQNSAGDGKLTLNEFHDLMSDAAFQAELKELKIDLGGGSSADSVYMAFDRTGDGNMNWRDFQYGLIKMSSSEVKRRDVCFLEGALINLAKIMMKIQPSQKELEKEGWVDRLHRLNYRCAVLSNTVEDLITEMGVFFRRHGYTPPPLPIN
eukprot:TRINITY_DN1826_c0_g1_i2.p1 TRINITY_DN1826_c0_g1~~TRINITY_DN1826_c0_g1_i2.p1  ORF type:complete len:529 (+),score=85.08 TRINITY_DN1826_c0_g1_i2:105-1589(+)